MAANRILSSRDQTDSLTHLGRGAAVEAPTPSHKHDVTSEHYSRNIATRRLCKVQRVVWRVAREQTRRYPAHKHAIGWRTCEITGNLLSMRS